MRHLIIIIIALGLTAMPAYAQTAADSSVYSVSDIATDVTADSAAHARDKAITQAQHLGFEQLLDRLGAEKTLAAKISDDDLATLVQNFEVQNERTSSVRYIGTFTVQFRPAATRRFLSNKNAHYTETRSKPMLILPIFQQGKTHPVLWEEVTPWRTAWDNAARGDTGLVPITVAPGGLDDISAISPDEAINGKSEALQNLTAKYHAGGVVVAIFHGNADKPTDPLTIDIENYDTNGQALDSSHVTVPASPTGVSLSDAMTQAVKLVRSQLEKNWRQAPKDDLALSSANPAQSSDTSMFAAGPVSQLPVVAPISQLSDLAQIKQSLSQTIGVQRVDVVSLQRGAANIQIAFHGAINDLQNALRNHNLYLAQDMTSGAWILHSSANSEPY